MSAWGVSAGKLRELSISCERLAVQLAVGGELGRLDADLSETIADSHSSMTVFELLEDSATTS
jgi:hypothetical protein